MTYILLLTSFVTICNTWKGECAEPIVKPWSLEITELNRSQILREIRACYHFGYDIAHDHVDLDKHESAQVTCSWKIVEGGV